MQRWQFMAAFKNHMVSDNILILSNYIGNLRHPEIPARRARKRHPENPSLIFRVPFSPVSYSVKKFFLHRSRSCSWQGRYT